MFGPPTRALAAGLAQLDRRVDAIVVQPADAFPARLVANDDQFHSWVEQDFDTQGRRKDKPDGRFGTLAYGQAVLPEGGALPVLSSPYPGGLPVWLRRVVLATGSDDEGVRYEIVGRPTGLPVNGYTGGGAVTPPADFTQPAIFRTTMLGLHLVAGTIRLHSTTASGLLKARLSVASGAASRTANNAFSVPYDGFCSLTTAADGVPMTFASTWFVTQAPCVFDLTIETNLTSGGGQINVNGGVFNVPPVGGLSLLAM